MKMDLRKIGLVALRAVNVAIYGAMATSCVIVVGNIIREKSKAKKEIPLGRTDYDKNVVKKYWDTKAQVEALFKKEATADIRVPINLKEVNSASFRNISKRAGDRFDSLLKNSIEGYVSDVEFIEAFSDIPEVKDKVVEMVGKIKALEVRKNRSAEDMNLINEYKKAERDYSSLIIYERGLMPKISDTFYSFARAAKKKDIPQFWTYMILTGPGFFLMLFGYAYTMFVLRTVKKAYAA